jgi:guanine deaminase
MPPETAVTDYSGCLIAPGFIDTHVHYVQTEIVASYGTQLLDWLDRYAFPAELAFADPAHAAAMARVFCDELLRNGTTTALVFCAVYPQSVDALFAEAERRGMRIAAGKVLMDRNAPARLRDTAQQGYDDSKALIARWHGRGRAPLCDYARFAGTSTAAQLDAAGTLWREHPDVFVHTHIAENRREVEWTAELFPQRKNYLDIYDHHGLIGRRAVLAHGVHLSEDELAAVTKAARPSPTAQPQICFSARACFRIAAMKDPHRPVHVGLGTDIGGGTELLTARHHGRRLRDRTARWPGAECGGGVSILRPSAARARSRSTTGSVRSHPAGRLTWWCSIRVRRPLLALRHARSHSVEDTLFALMMLGDDRAVRATYVAGQLAHLRET